MVTLPKRNADLILLNGKIITVDQNFTIADAAVGSNKEYSIGLNHCRFIHREKLYQQPALDPAECYKLFFNNQ